jgi:hypothetical protein
MLRYLFLFFILMGGFINAVTGQSDSIKLARSAKDSLAKAKRTDVDSITSYLDKKPRTALFLGLLVPGAGQAFNKRWWKLPLAYGAYGFAVYRIDDTRKRYKEWDNYFSEAVETGQKVTVAPGIDFDSRQIKTYRDRFRDDKDRAVFLMIGIHALTALEAFVDAHLKNFNIDDDLGLILTSPGLPGPAIGFTYKLH